MIEARITCLIQNLIVDDLGLKLARGDIIYLDEDVARNSKDLLRVARAQGVHVQYVQRAQQVRAAVGIPKRGPIVIVQPPARPDPVPAQAVVPARFIKASDPEPLIVSEPETPTEPEPIEGLEEVDSLWDPGAEAQEAHEAKTAKKKGKKPSTEPESEDSNLGV